MTHLRNLVIFVLVHFLLSCSSSLKKETPLVSALPSLEKYAWPGDPQQVGGFSGLLFLGKSNEGGWQFITHTDRGPNGDPLTVKGRSARPFLQPQFQPHLLKLQTQTSAKGFVVQEKIFLTDPLGRPLSGLPPQRDELPIDSQGKKLVFDKMGVDPESIAVDDQGFYWLGEEYSPSILKFSPQGKLLKRFVPQGSLSKKDLQALKKKFGSEVVVDSLPAQYRHRKSNRGFEGLTYKAGKIYALLQSPLEIPEDQKKALIRLLEFDINSEKVTGEFFYPLTRPGVDKMGDLTSRPGMSQLCAIEQNGKIGPTSTHLVTCFELSTGPDKIIKPEVLVDLVKVGYDFAEKVEGLSFIDAKTLAVLNDNDFAVTESYKISTLGIIHLP